MTLIVEITAHGAHGHAAYHRVAALPLSIGRAFSNDIILDDPYIAAAHLRVTESGDAQGAGGFTVQDMGSENGTLLNGAAIGRAPVRVKSGDSLRIGRTELRLLRADHAVAPALRLQKSSRFFAWAESAFWSWTLFLLSMGGMALWSYLEIWSEQPGMAAVISVSGAFAIVIVWAALWTAAGRLMQHKSTFRAQLALASAFLLASSVFSCVQAYVHFLTSEGMAAQLFSYGGNTLLAFALVYGCLSFATDLPRRKRLLGAFYFAGGLLASVCLLNYASAQNFDEDAPYAYTLEPALSSLAPAGTLDSFMKDNARLFESAIFTAERAQKTP